MLDALEWKIEISVPRARFSQDDASSLLEAIIGWVESQSYLIGGGYHQTAENFEYEFGLCPKSDRPIPFERLESLRELVHTFADARGAGDAATVTFGEFDYDEATQENLDAMIDRVLRSIN